MNHSNTNTIQVGDEDAMHAGRIEEVKSAQESKIVNLPVILSSLA